MTEQEIIKTILMMQKVSQEELAHRVGYKSQTNIAGLLNNSKRGMRVDKLVQLLDALGYELVIREQDPEEGMEFTIER